MDRTDDSSYRRTFHSNQGRAYQMKAHKNQLAQQNIFQCKSRKGNCFDNPPPENFFGLLKQEMYYGVIYASFKQLKQAIEDWIHYYNHHRIKTKLGFQYRERITA
ncbi:IS3 family transposase [Listeria seeligeri]|uniref:IS3 family transposase n=1 Tax=Listeria seeligeri TaxID=1640 RepID=UPI0016240762|nr:IS3 family transposase [Listeria seeligeri]MBF2606131.1 IS3 family transposase [Listeria seeligeri]